MFIFIKLTNPTLACFTIQITAHFGNGKAGASYVESTKSHWEESSVITLIREEDIGGLGQEFGVEDATKLLTWLSSLLQNQRMNKV